MSIMDIKPYMSKTGFSRRDSKHIIIEQDGKLWLAFASEGAASFMSSASQASGLLAIEAVSDGNVIPYAYSATEAMLTISTDKGSMKITIDRDAGALRFEGSGFALRLDAKAAPQRATSLALDTGIELSVGGGRYFFKAITGTISFDDTWVLNKFQSVTPVLDLNPDKGNFALAAFELPPDSPPPAITKSLETCAAENAGDFSAFTDLLLPLPQVYSELRLNIAYLLWTGSKTNPDNSLLILNNKLSTNTTESWLLSIASLAFTDLKTALRLISALPPAAPPIQAFAVLRLLEAGLFVNLSRKDIAAIYDTLVKSAHYWHSERASLTPNLSFYAYRYESSLLSNALFSAGEPVIAPDLNAYLILLSEVLSRLSELIRDSGNTMRWREKATAQLVAFLAALWNGEYFTALNIYSNERSMPDPLLSYIPLVLAKRIPTQMLGKMLESLDEASVFTPLGALIISGLVDADESGIAEEKMKAALTLARDKGINCPYYGAALIFAANKVFVKEGWR